MKSHLTKFLSRTFFMNQEISKKQILFLVFELLAIAWFFFSYEFGAVIPVYQGY